MERRHLAMRQTHPSNGRADLSPPVDGSADLAGMAQAVARTREVVGGSLAGVVAFGSWARGELTDASDIDVLIVVDPGTPVRRALYRRWDESPIVWNGHPIEPHFARLPDAGEPLSGFWAEVATEGVLLLERDPRLSAHLLRVRDAVAKGRLRRRVAHGHGYWTGIG